ncbi:MAG: signal peptidase I [Solirubrobacteraceae bacterium]
MTKTKKPLVRAAAELVLIVVIAIGLALGIQAFIVKPYEIPSGSMLPTLQINQRILVDRIGTHFSSPKVGDIYVFHPPASETCADSREGENSDGQDAPAACDVAQRRESSQTYVKRVVGLPGDRLSIRDGHVYRDGVREPDAYTIPCRGGGGECSFPQTITVPRGDYYMMGDNRSDSLDSRFWGPVPRSWLIGEAFLTYWPPSRIGLL